MPCCGPITPANGAPPVGSGSIPPVKAPVTAPNTAPCSGSPPVIADPAAPVAAPIAIAVAIVGSHIVYCPKNRPNS